MLVYLSVAGAVALLQALRYLLRTGGPVPGFYGRAPVGGREVPRWKAWTLPIDAACLAVLIVVPAMRGDEVGTDTSMYTRVFGTLIDPSSYSASLAASEQETGYTMLQFIVRQFTADPRWMLTVCAVLTCVIWYVTICAFSRMPELSVMVWVLSGTYLLQMNIMRQSLAMSLIILAACLAFRRRTWWALLPAVIGATIHNSGVAGLVVVLILLIVRRTRASVASAVIAGIVGLAAGEAIGAVPALQNAAVSLMPRYEAYTESGTGPGQGVARMLLVAWSLGLVIYTIVRTGGKGRRWPELVWLQIGIAFQGIGLGYVALDRISLYFTSIEAFLVPMVVSRLRKRFLDVCVILVGYAAIFVLNVGQVGQLVPYGTGLS